GALDLVVEVGDVGLMVLSVVVIDRLGRNVRGQRVARPRQGRKFDRHGVLLVGLAWNPKYKASRTGTMCVLRRPRARTIRPKIMDTLERIKQTVTSHPIVLFMKG